MDLILWRHAQAEDGYPDLGRQLTAKGHKQAEQMAKWLRPRLPKETLILVSPAARTLQTVEPLGADYKTVKEIAPGASYSAIVDAAGWPHYKGAVLVVGHQPTLGQVVGWLLCNDAQEWPIKKGAVWWLSNPSGDAVMVRAVMLPELL